MSTDTVSNGISGSTCATGGSDTSENKNGGSISPNEAAYNQVAFLPIIHSILRTIEKDNQDASQKNRDSLEASQKITELSKEIETARSYIKQLPGITDSKQVQDQRLQNLYTQLEMKKKLISKYKGMNMKLGTSVPDENNSQATGENSSGQK